MEVEINQAAVRINLHGKMKWISRVG